MIRPLPPARAAGFRSAAGAWWKVVRSLRDRSSVRRQGKARSRSDRSTVRFSAGAPGIPVKGSRPMTETEDVFTAVAIDAARQAGALIKASFGGVLGVNELMQYDIKLELDVRSQEL